MALNQEKVKDNRFSEVVEDKKLNAPNSFYQFLEIITFLLIILGLTIVSFYNYLLYHSIVEIFSIVIACVMVNSIQYNENAQIEVNIIISQTKENNRNCVKIEFLDNGIGIQDFKKQTIFKRGGSKQKGGKGMGIGLSLVKMIVDSYNGRIWVEDRIKGDHSKGSNFILMFPEIT